MVDYFVPGSASPSPAFFKVCYESSPSLLQCRSLRCPGAVELTEVCELLLTVAQQQDCPYWLLDGRTHTQEQPGEFHEWLREEFFPRARAVLGRQLHVAVVVLPAEWQGLPQKGYDHPLDWHSLPARLGWFTQEADALAWLAQQRGQ